MKKKKILVSLLCATAAFGLAACNEQPVDPTDPVTPPVTENPVTPPVTEAPAGFKATIVYNNGTANGELNAVQEGDQWYFDKPSNPTKEYNSFKGWFTDEACTSPFNFDNPVTANITLYAGWEQGYDTVNTIWDFKADASTIVANPSGNVSVTEDTQFGKFFIASGARFEISSDESKNCVNTQKKKVTFELTGAGTNNSFTINYKWASSSAGTLQIVNVETQAVVFENLECKNGDAATTETVSNLPAGVYEIVSTGSVRIYALSLSEKLPQGPTSGIEVSDSAVQKDFLLGREFNTNGLVVNLAYENGRKDAIDAENYTVTTEDLTTSGVKKVTISYQLNAATTYTASYNITVWEAKSLKLYTHVLDSKRVTINAQEIYAAAPTKFADDAIVVKAVCQAEGVEGAKEFLLDSSEYTVGAVQADSVAFTYGNLAVDYEFAVVNVPDLSAATSVTVNVDPAANISTANNLYTFNTVNQALQFLELAKVADNCVKTISLKEGAVFAEKVEINMPNVVLTTNTTSVDDSTKYATIEFDAYNGLIDPSEKITYSTDGSASVSIREAAEGFKAQYINFANTINTLEEYNALKDITTGTQAVAVLVQADKSVFLNCTFTGYQDTLYAQVGRQYYENCYIEGHTDFIFGYDATAYFQECEIMSIGAGTTSNNGGYIVATKGNPSGLNYGYIFNECNFTADNNTMDGSISLARGWDSGMTMMVMNSTIDAHYSKEAYGYKTPDNPETEEVEKDLNDRYGKMNAAPVAAQLLEYNNTGAGAISESLENTCTVVNAEVYAKFDSLRKVFTADNGKTVYADNWAGVVEADVVVTLMSGSETVGTVKDYSGNKLRENLCTAPEVANKKFAGWYSDAALTTKYNFDSVLVAGSFSLYAKYETTNYVDYSLEIPEAGTWTAETALDEDGLFYATKNAKVESLKIEGASYAADNLTFERQISLTSGKAQLSEGSIINAIKVVIPEGKNAVINVYAAQKSDKTTNLVVLDESANAKTLTNLKKNGESINAFDKLSISAVDKYSFNATGGNYYIGGAGGGAYIYGIVVSIEADAPAFTPVSVNFNNLAVGDITSEIALADGLITIVGNPDRKFAVDANAQKIKDAAGNDVDCTNRLKTGGSTNSKGRYIIVDLTNVSGNVTLEVYAMTGSNGEARTGQVRLGTLEGQSVLVVNCPVVNSGDGPTLSTVALTGGNVYYITADASINFYGINLK